MKEKLFDFREAAQGAVQQTQMDELTKGEAYAIAEFIDCNIFDAIRNDTEWDSFQNLRNLVHGYEKCCLVSGFVGLTDSASDAKPGRYDWEREQDETEKSE